MYIYQNQGYTQKSIILYTIIYLLINYALEKFGVSNSIAIAINLKNACQQEWNFVWFVTTNSNKLYLHIWPSANGRDGNMKRDPVRSSRSSRGHVATMFPSFC